MQGSPLESSMSRLHRLLSFFFNDTATTEIYTLSLHDALPISGVISSPGSNSTSYSFPTTGLACNQKDRKSTRLNSSHLYISYAVFCLKKTRGLDCSPSTPMPITSGPTAGSPNSTPRLLLFF